MPLEYVTRCMSFDNLLVEVKVVRWICDDCLRCEAFHDTPPYGENLPTPQSRGWQLVARFDDGEDGARCPKCVADLEARRAETTTAQPLSAGQSEVRNER
jgi:phage FluMu protein Com